MEFIFGLVGVLLGIGIFLLGFHVGKQTVAPVKLYAVLSNAEQARIEKERQEMLEDQKAFRQLVGYSADIAYGLTDFKPGSDKQ